MQLPLKEQLVAMADRFRSYQPTGVEFKPEACRAIAAGLQEFAARAGELERAEATLAQMEAVARDLDVLPHIQQMRHAVVSVPGSNVVLWPIVPRPVPTGGGDAA